MNGKGTKVDHLLAFFFLSTVGCILGLLLGFLVWYIIIILGYGGWGSG